MHHGHRGINHPVLNLKTGKGEITSQNHGFVISKSSIDLNPAIQVTHRHLNDDTIAGIEIVHMIKKNQLLNPKSSPYKSFISLAS